MKLFLIERRGADPGYDEAQAFVIRAEDEAAARNMAAGDCGDEGADVWLLDQTECTELTGAGSPEIIIRDFQAG